MKPVITIIVSILITSLVPAQTKQEQEVCIVGTMHTVPKIVKHSYKPMLKRAVQYQPDAIYVESPRAEDSLSWAYLKNGWSTNYKTFYQLSDSLQNVFKPNNERFVLIMNKSFNAMTESDLEFLISTFAFRRDNANYEFYNYIKAYGVHGSKTPTRHEDGDLTFKLALALDIKLLNAMDDQRTNGEYHDAWRECVKEGRTNGNNAINKRLNKKDYNSAIFPAIFRGLGRHTNTMKSLQRLHAMASFTYVAKPTPGCTKGERYWNERNTRMANNIAEQVIESETKRNLVVVGAAHVVGIQNALKEKYPNLKVILMYD